METSLNRYEQAVLKRICDRCIEVRDDGSCGMDPKLECSVKEHLPRIVQMVRGVTSDRIGDYVTRLREDVCTICTQAADDGSCEPRELVDCSLDRYFPLVVEAIEEIDREQDGPVS